MPAVVLPGCPVVMKSEFEHGYWSEKSNLYSFSTGQPNKASIDKREDRLCKAACADGPIHTNVLNTLKHIQRGTIGKRHYMLVRATNRFPSSQKLLCACEGVCNRANSITLLRFVT